MTKLKLAKNSIDMTGKRVNRLTVLYPVKKTKKQLHWHCRCDCGNEIDVMSMVLRRKRKIKSCGCQRNEVLRKRRWRGYGEISKTYWSALKDHSKSRGYIFKIKIEDAWNLFLKQNKKCGLTGLLLCFPVGLKNKTKDQTASLDRIDSSKGYTIDNIMWVHKEINYLKNCLPNGRFVELCKLVAKHHS